MGCWNGTCLISNLPIYAGDKVVFFILRRKRGAELARVEQGHYYVDDLYEPILYPIVGEYDDYGCIENVKEDFSLLEKYFENVELTQKEWDKDNDVFRNVERGNYKEHTFALIHKDIYDALIEHLTGREEWWSEGKGIKDYVMENIEKKTKEYTESKERWGKLEGIDLPPSVYAIDDFVCGRRTSDYFIAKYLETQDETLLDKLIESHLINCALTFCRKFWFPQTGAGSQDDESKLYQVLANKVIEKCKQRDEECE
jgi:hypothetical protein